MASTNLGKSSGSLLTAADVNSLLRFINDQIGLGVTNPSSKIFLQDSSTFAISMNCNGGSGRNFAIQSRTDGNFQINDDSAGSLRIKIDSAGVISLPAVYSHDMNGETYRDLLINNSGELGYDSSTLTKKTNIIDFDDNDDIVLKLRPVKFNYKKKILEKSKKTAKIFNSKTGILEDKEIEYYKDKYIEEAQEKQEFGLIAEEVEKIRKELVFYNKDGSIEGVHYRLFVPFLIKSIQNLDKRLKELEQ